MPAQNLEPKPPSTPTKPKFSRKTRLAKGVMNRSSSGSCTQPERDGGNSSKKATERLPRTPPQVEATIPTRRKTSQHCESKAPKPRPGEPRKEKRTVSQFYAFRRVKAITTGRTENGLKKEERHDRTDSAYDKARTGTRAESKPPRK